MIRTKVFAPMSEENKKVAFINAKLSRGQVCYFQEIKNLLS